MRMVFHFSARRPDDYDPRPQSPRGARVPPRVSTHELVMSDLIWVGVFFGLPFLFCLFHLGREELGVVPARLLVVGMPIVLIAVRAFELGRGLRWLRLAAGEGDTPSAQLRALRAEQARPPAAGLVVMLLGGAMAVIGVVGWASTGAVPGAASHGPIDAGLFSACGLWFGMLGIPICDVPAPKDEWLRASRADRARRLAFLPADLLMVLLLAGLPALLVLGAGLRLWWSEDVHAWTFAAVPLAGIAVRVLMPVRGRLRPGATAVHALVAAGGVTLLALGAFRWVEGARSPLAASSMCAFGGLLIALALPKRVAAPAAPHGGAGVAGAPGSR
ncbi:MAG: hypothetical protein U1E73_10775 [Planctomycetota bacterium]